MLPVAMAQPSSNNMGRYENGQMDV